MDAMTEDEYVGTERKYIIELTRKDATNLVHAAYMHAERLNADESKRLMDSANQLASQCVHNG